MTQRALFPGQQPNEQVYLVIREHWFYLLNKLIIWLVFVAIFFTFEQFVPSLVPGLFEKPYVNYIDLFRNIYLIFLTIGLLAIWTFYYLNLQIVTDQRLVDISQHGIFHHRVSELDLSRIQDVTAETKGLFAMLFNFGNVYVQTAGNEQRFIFNNVPHPDKVEKMLLDLFEKQSATTQPPPTQNNQTVPPQNPPV